LSNPIYGSFKGLVAVSVNWSSYVKIYSESAICFSTRDDFARLIHAIKACLVALAISVFRMLFFDTRFDEETFEGTSNSAQAPDASERHQVSDGETILLRFDLRRGQHRRIESMLYWRVTKSNHGKGMPVLGKFALLA
jgi:hypothetical protein